MNQKIKKVYVEHVMGEEIVEVQVKNFNELIETLEKNNPDSAYFYDVNLSVLLNYLYEAGYNSDDIIKLNNNIYGDFINFYYLKDYNLYVMEFGTC